MSIRVFNRLVLNGQKARLDGKVYKLVLGKHSIWLPELDIKFIWARNGKIEALRDWDKGLNKEALLDWTYGTEERGYVADSLQSIMSEYLLLRKLSELEMAPKVGELVFVKEVISRYLHNVKICDPIGLYGYVVQNAKKAKQKGQFSLAGFKAVEKELGILPPSEGAYGDLAKPDNVINGYLIDIRRTIWDTIRLPLNEEWQELLTVRESPDDIERRVRKFGQFPFGERPHPYQSYLLGDSYVTGSRNTLYRMRKMKIPFDLSGKTVVDLGCCTGAFCLESAYRGATKVTGLDNIKEYIWCARDLARYNGFGINFMVMNLSEPHSVGEWIRYVYDTPVDIVFALSLFKHVKKFWKLLQSFPWRVCYIESQAAMRGINTPHVQKMVKRMRGLDGVVIANQFKTTDRSPRYVWELRKN